MYSAAVSNGASKGHAVAAMLLTTATVHAGASGGAVVNTDGCVVGITTSNARHSASGSTIPNLNFAVAADALQPLWQLAAQPCGLTPANLQELDIKDAALLDIWTISRPPEQSLPEQKADLSGQNRMQGSARLSQLLSKNHVGDSHPKPGGQDHSIRLRSNL